MQEEDSLYGGGVITGSDLSNQEDRTLIWGYTTDRRSWHVYLKDGEIHSYVYGVHNGDSFTKLSVSSNEGYIPNKRLYPECCAP